MLSIAPAGRQHLIAAADQQRDCVVDSVLPMPYRCDVVPDVAQRFIEFFLDVCKRDRSHWYSSERAGEQLLFVPQGGDGVEPRRLQCRPHAEEEADAGGGGEAGDDGPHWDG